MWLRFYSICTFRGGCISSLKTPPLTLRIQTFFQSLKKDKLNLKNCFKIKFEYLKILSIVVFCTSAVLILLNFIFNVNICSFYKNLNSKQQGLFTDTF